MLSLCLPSIVLVPTPAPMTGDIVSGRISYSPIGNDQQCFIFRGLHRVKLSAGYIRTTAPGMMILGRNVHKEEIAINALEKRAYYKLGHTSVILISPQLSILFDLPT